MSSRFPETMKRTLQKIIKKCVWSLQQHDSMSSVVEGLKHLHLIIFEPIPLSDGKSQFKILIFP